MIEHCLSSFLQQWVFKISSFQHRIKINSDSSKLYCCFLNIVWRSAAKVSVLALLKQGCRFKSFSRPLYVWGKKPNTLFSQLIHHINRYLTKQLGGLRYLKQTPLSKDQGKKRLFPYKEQSILCFKYIIHINKYIFK